MKSGAGKRKGSAFEREVCTALSRWITGNKRDDVFWRSAMSGGRATVHGTKVRQAGDICAVAPEGHVLCDEYFIECKHIKKLGLDQAIMKNTGPLAKFWRVACKQAKQHDKKPLIIARQNGWPPLVMYRTGDLALTPRAQTTEFSINHFDDLLRSRPALKAVR